MTADVGVVVDDPGNDQVNNDYHRQVVVVDDIKMVRAVDDNQKAFCPGNDLVAV